MNILVTGGAGFIGSHVVDALVDDHLITVVDDLSYGHEHHVNQEAIFLNLSITDPGIDDIFVSGNFDAVLHFAAQKGVRPSFDDPVFDAELNVIGLLRILEASRKHNVKNVVLASTGGTIYGEAQEIPTPETASIDPQSPYTITKRAGELYLRYYSNRFGMNGVTMRLANIFGPRQDPAGEAGVVSIFIERLLAGQPLTIYGDGNQTRDYLYIDDAVAAFVAVVDQMGSGIAGDYNVGTGQETSVNQIVGAIERVYGNPIEVKHTEAIVGELKRSAIASQLFAEKFNWQPEVSLNEGIEQTWEWFKSGGFSVDV
ncbi:MAG: UDP-glucose 4-epimerase [Candidatus Kerfeldbacteria bacterium CG15_BIG_FIL_POST_REV_8_21_14_020_45_12]|uniref:UDP-glucose 4-epimerase n=1 Tax=Candidatus Kerfeldbacteria bacterium CG15_BIG_FIL_POST_REV_8_21_14_020_45_12 TaxID=2014247 RepID=A0A2M7H3H8_9BACT|nr:MAG: UDP-glucose 4-epimerase [Candidatus Kerfeldbacteria bacterium CG15_BIG_FIL_POST_REV_8_21_14_020_45_12]PJA93821.1 MAG: UDP-glucose 4-epimerase [Candidatus Kerfeldbacteria bacterium CG_4_9_14_3_um_filter_45_8]